MMSVATAGVCSGLRSAYIDPVTVGTCPCPEYSHQIKKVYQSPKDSRNPRVFSTNSTLLVLAQPTQSRLQLFPALRGQKKKLLDFFALIESRTVAIEATKLTLREVTFIVRKRGDIQ